MTTQERLREELAQLVEDYCKSPKEDVLAWIKIHPKAIDSLLQLTETEIIQAKLDVLNDIRNSDTKQNHGTIELMGHMSQELNKQKQRTTLRGDNK